MEITELVQSCKDIIYKLGDGPSTKNSSCSFNRNSNHNDWFVIRYPESSNSDGYDLTNLSYSATPQFAYSSTIKSLKFTFPLDIKTENHNLESCLYASRTGVNPWMGIGEERIKEGFRNGLIKRDVLMFVEYSANVFPKLLFSVPKDGEALIFQGQSQDPYIDYEDFTRHYPQLDFLKHLKEILV
jgi:hypothetical protein